MHMRQEWSLLPDLWQEWQVQDEAFLSLARLVTGVTNQACIVL